MSYVVSFDPGLRTPGLGIFQDRKLIHGTIIRNPLEQDRDAKAWNMIALKVEEVVQQVLGKKLFRFVYEMPQVYQQGHQKGDQDDILQLVGVNGAVCGVLLDQITELRAYRPAQWKGQVPKPVHNKRVLAELTDEEKAKMQSCPASLLHNQIDGVGLGLYDLGRMNVLASRIQG